MMTESARTKKKTPSKKKAPTKLKDPTRRSRAKRAPEAIIDPPAGDLRTEHLLIDEIELHANHRVQQRDPELQGLMDTMSKHGQLQPIRVREQKQVPGLKIRCAYVLVAGYRRIMAAKQLGWQQIRAEILPAGELSLVELERATENVQRCDLNVIEEALAVEAMLNLEDLHGPDRRNHYLEVAARLGKSESWVRDRDYLTRLGPEARRLGMAGLLPAGHLREIAKIGDHGEQLSIAAQALRDYFHHEGDKKGRAACVKHLIERADSGAAERLTVDEVRLMIEQHKRSLRLVAWELDQDFADRIACTGCRDNTATDATLFGPSEDDAGRGSCMNQSCFDAKTSVAERARSASIDKLRKQKKDATAENVRSVTPVFLKAAGVQRAAKRVLGSRTEKHLPSSAGERQTSGPKERRVRDPKAQLEQAITDWHGDSVERVLKHIARRRAMLPAVALLIMTSEWTRDGGFLRRRASSTSPSPRLRELIQKTAAATTDMDLIDLAKGIDVNGQASWLMRDPLQDAPSPTLIVLAETLDVTLEAQPTLADFEKPAEKPETPKQIKTKGKKAKTPKSASSPEAKGSSSPGVCRDCGCTDERACPGGCDWVEPDLCSQCAVKAYAPSEGASTWTQPAKPKTQKLSWHMWVRAVQKSLNKGQDVLIGIDPKDPVSFTGDRKLGESYLLGRRAADVAKDLKDALPVSAPGSEYGG